MSNYHDIIKRIIPENCIWDEGYENEFSIVNCPVKYIEEVIKEAKKEDSKNSTIVISKLMETLRKEKINNITLSKGVNLIAEERRSQITEHKWNLKDESYYNHNELIKAALFSINPDQFEWPFNWDEEFRAKMLQKNYIERLVCAAALIASQVDIEIETYLENNRIDPNEYDNYRY